MSVATLASTRTAALGSSNLPSIFSPAVLKSNLLVLRDDAMTMVTEVARLSESDGYDMVRDVIVLRELTNENETQLFTVLVVDECSCCYTELKLDDLIAIPMYFEGVVPNDFITTDAIEHLTQAQALDFAKHKAMEFIAVREDMNAS